MNISQSIQLLHPTLEFGLDYIVEDHGKGQVLTWFNKDISKPTQEELEQAWVDLQPKLVIEEMRRKRKPEYPDMGDQMDAVIKHFNWRRMQGDPLIQELDDIVNKCLAVKAKYPDPNNK